MHHLFGIKENIFYIQSFHKMNTFHIYNHHVKKDNR